MLRLALIAAAFTLTGDGALATGALVGAGSNGGVMSRGGTNATAVGTTAGAAEIFVAASSALLTAVRTNPTHVSRAAEPTVHITMRRSLCLRVASDGSAGMGSVASGLEMRIETGFIGVGEGGAEYAPMIQYPVGPRTRRLVSKSLARAG